MAARSDLLLEVNTTLDGSGAYTSDWFDSGDVEAVTVVWYFGGSSIPGVGLDEGLDGTAALWEASFPQSAGHYGSGTLAVAARFFRLSVAGGQSGTAFAASLRAVAG